MKTELREISASNAGSDKLVYVRRLALEEARQIVPSEALEALKAPDDLFSVHAEDGQRLAIVEGRDAAFATARAHDFRPRSVH